MLDQDQTLAIQLIEAIRTHDASAVRHLLAENASLVEGRLDTNGRTPLHEAAALGNAEAIPLLLHSGANPMALDKDGNPPFFLALHHRHYGALDLLLQDPRSNVNYVRESDQVTAIHAASYNDDLPSVERLLDLDVVLSGRAQWHRDRSPESAEMLAVICQYPEILKAFADYKTRAAYPALDASLPLDATKAAALLQTRGGWQRLAEIDAHFPLTKEFLLDTRHTDDGTPLASRAVACYETTALLDFLEKKEACLTPQDLTTGTPAEANGLLKCFIERHALPQLFGEKNWQSQSSHNMQKVWQCVPDEEQWQVPNIQQLRLAIRQYETSQSPALGRG